MIVRFSMILDVFLDYVEGFCVSEVKNNGFRGVMDVATCPKNHTNEDFSDLGKVEVKNY